MTLVSIVVVTVSEFAEVTPSNPDRAALTIWGQFDKTVLLPFQILEIKAACFLCHNDKSAEKVSVEKMSRCHLQDFVHKTFLLVIAAVWS